MLLRCREIEPRRGVVLLMVLVVVVLLALAAYQYSDLMVSEYKAAHNAHRAAQAKHFAESGIHYAAALLADPEEIAVTLGGNVLDNPDAFRDVTVGDKGRFSLMAPADPFESAGNVRFGLIDEAGKINVNAIMKRDAKGQLLYDMLIKLPTMPEPVAASIADWLDSDNDPRPNGAENDYYSGERLPYRAKNGAIASLDELLLVKGMTPELLYGTDLNRNGVEDPGEAGAEGFDRGLSAYLTVYSRETNTDTQGLALAYINETDLTALYERLASDTASDNLAKFVILYRQYGPANASGQQQSLTGSINAIIGGGKNQKKGKGGKNSNRTPTPIKGNLADFTPDLEGKKASKKISSFFDLVNVQVSVPAEAQNQPAVIYDSPLNDTGARRELLPKLFEHATIFEEADIPARININTAPREVVGTIQDLTEADVEAILTVRPKASSIDLASEVYQTPAWLLTEANLKVDTLKKIEKAITTRSQVYRVQSLGYGDDKGPAARIEAVIDMNAGRPRIVYWRDMSELGVNRGLLGRE